MSRLVLGTVQPYLQLVNSYCSGIKQPGCETGHLQKSGAVVKDVWSYAIVPPPVVVI